MHGALVARVEPPAGADRFPVAVEVQADQFALGVEHRRARVAAGGVQVGQEVDSLGLQRRVGGAAEVTLGDRCQQRLGCIERVGVGVLLDDAGHGGHRRVGHAIARVQRLDLAVADAQGAVGIRVHRAALLGTPGEQRLHVGRAQAQLLAFAGLALVLDAQLRGHQRTGHADQRIGGQCLAFACGGKARQALRFLTQLGTGIQGVQRLGQLLWGTTKGRVELGHALRVRQLLVAGQQGGQQGLLDLRRVTALDLLEHPFDHRLVALLVAALALRVRLGRFDAQAFQQQRRAQQLALRGHLLQQQVTLAHRRTLRQVGQQRLDVTLVPAVGGSQHGRLVGGTLGLRIAAQQAFQLAGGALAVVLQRLQLRGVAGARLCVLGAGGLDGVDHLLEHRHAARQHGIDLAGEFGRGAVAVGDARVTGQHRVIAFLRAFHRHLQVCRRLVGHVVLAVGGRLAVLAHVGAQQGEVAGVARPHEVVDLIAVVADRARRRIHQAHVAQFQLGNAVEIGAVVHVGHRAAHAAVLLALGHDLLAGRIDGIEVGAAGLATRLRQHLVGHLVEADGDQHAEVRVGRALVGTVPGDEATSDQVVLGRAVVLDHAHRHVVVGQQQAVGGHERAGAATGTHHGAQRRCSDVGQVGRIALETCGLQRLGQFRQLGRHPHAFIGVGAGGEGQAQGQGGGEGFAW